MKSPFAIMRKHQRTLLAGVTLLAIIVFVLGDSLSRSQSNGVAADKVVVETDAGDLTTNQINQLNNRRQTANRFIYRAAQICEIPPGQIPQFGFGVSATDYRKDIVFGYLLNQEADKIGIVVDDAAVSNFIDEFTQNKLSQGDFVDICKDMQVGQQAIYSALSGELQARFAMQILSPRLPLAPEQYWNIFKKLEVKRSIEAAPVYVKDFVDEVPTPDDAKLREYFETYRAEEENTSEENFTAGFKQPRRVKLQYVTLRFADIRESLKASSPVSDKEVEDYYAANKENYRIDDLPELTGDSDDASKPVDPLFAPDAEAADDKKPKAPAEKEKATESQPAAAGDPASEAKDQEAPGKEEEKSEADGETGEDEQSSLPADVLVKTVSASGNSRGIVLAQAVGEGDSAAGETDSSAEETPVENASEEGGEPAAPKLEAPAETEAKPDDAAENKEDPPAADEKPVENSAEKPTPGADETKKEEMPPEPKYRELDESLREEIRAQLLDERARAKIVADAEKVFDAMSENANDHLDALEVEIDVDSKEETGPRKPDAATIAAEAESAEKFLRRLAKEYNGEYAETGAISQLEMLMMGESEDGELSTLDTLGQASEPGQSEFSPRGNSAVGLAFGSTMLYGVYQVVGGISSDRFIFWKVDDIEEHVPTWDEPGIQEQVLKAWKLKEARKLAKARAEELAKQVGDNKLAESLPEGVESSETAEFSWLYEPAPLSPNPMAGKPPATISEVTFTTSIDGESGIVKPGNKFMELVFEELSVGKVGVAVNSDRSAYYVVRVKSSDTTDPDIVGDKFITGRMFTPPMLRQFMSTPYDEISGRESQNARYEWSQQFQKSHGVKWIDGEG